MASNIGVSSGNTGNITSNPQSTGLSTLNGSLQTVQNSSNSTSINTQTAAVVIPLQPEAFKTSSLHAVPLHQTNYPVFISMGALIILAIAVSIYIYLDGKKKYKNT